MKFYVIVFSLFFLSAAQIPAQISSDRVKNLMHYQGVDSIKSRLYFEMAKEYFHDQADSCYKYGMKSLAIATKGDYTRLISKGSLQLARLKFILDEVDSAMYYCKQSLSFAGTLTDSNLILQGTWLKGTIYRKMDKIPEALGLFKQSLLTALKKRDTLLASNIYISISDAFTPQNQYDSAIYYILKAQQLKYQLHDTLGIGTISLNKSRIYYLLGEYDMSEKEALLSIPINKRYHQKQNLELNYSRMGMLMLKKEQLIEALSYYDSSMTIAKDLNLYNQQANLYLNMGTILVGQGKYDEALKVYQQLYELDKANDFVPGELKRFTNIGLVYEHKKQYARAQQYYDSALVLAKSSGSFNSLDGVYYHKFKAHALSGDFKNAFRCQSLYFKIQDSLFSMERTKFIKELEFKYEREKKDADILRLKHQALKKDAMLKSYRYQTIIGIILSGAIILILILIAYFQKQKEKKNKLIHYQEVKTLVAKEKAAAARALVDGQEEERRRIALELHDGIGAMLSSIKVQFTSFISRSSQNDEVMKQAAKVLDKAAVDVRRISHNMMPAVLSKFGLNISLEELIDAVNDTGGIEASANIQGDDKNLTDNIQIMVYRIIQELVNNTLKHAKASQISLILEYATEELNIMYSDNGVGFTPGLKDKTMGLKSIDSRVRFMSGELVNESMSGKGSSYIIRIPFITLE